jgi:plastocyanin
MIERALATGAVLLLLALPAAAHTETVKGSVELGVEDALIENAGPIVVYLDKGDTASGTAANVPPARGPLQPVKFEIRQRHARFSPAFLVVARGDKVLMPNDDTIFHNVFSYSRPNDFDLGLYARGEMREVVFEHTGPVNLYCSIHESMSATVYVTPSRLFAIASADGRFAIEGVTPGRYRLRSWSRRLPAAETWVDVKKGEPAQVRLVIPQPVTP